MDTSHPLPDPVTVTPKPAWKSLTIIGNIVAPLLAFLTAPQLMDLLGAMGANSLKAKVLAIAGSIGALNVLVRVFKTKAPIAGTPAESAARDRSAPDQR